MRVGTSNFVSRQAAALYYAGQEPEVESTWSGLRKIKYMLPTIERMIEAKEITIGPPEPGPGQRVITIDGGKRYGLEDM